MYKIRVTPPPLSDTSPLPSIIISVASFTTFAGSLRVMVKGSEPPLKIIKKNVTLHPALYDLYHGFRQWYLLISLILPCFYEMNGIPAKRMSAGLPWNQSDQQVFAFRFRYHDSTAGIAPDIGGRPQHIQDTVHRQNKSDALKRKADCSQDDRDHHQPESQVHRRDQQVECPRRGSHSDQSLRG